MTEALIFDTRHLSEGDREVYAGPRRITLSPNLLQGWVAYCPKHDLGLRVDTRDEARKGRETVTWCYGCISDAQRPERVLSDLRYAQSSECGCMRAWPSIRLVIEDRGQLDSLVARCEGCGAVPTWFHYQTLHKAIDKGGESRHVICACGFRADWETELEHHVVDANKAVRFEAQGYGRWTRG